MTYLLTGSTGFLGKFINETIPHAITMSRSLKSDLNIDLAKTIPDCPAVDVVIHNAGLAHTIPKNEEESKKFFEVNYTGTLNLLKGLEATPPQQFVFISTVAVYGVETGMNISEEHPLNGNSPYALSKIKAEKLVSEWGKEHNIPVVILRLPLIAGPNPPGNLGKMIRGIKTGRYVSIAKGQARRSVVLAKDVANLISRINSISGIYNLTDGYHPRFREIEQIISGQLKKPMPVSIPGWLAGMLGRFGDWIPGFPVNSDTVLKMSSDLYFDDRKARREIGWNPELVVNSFSII